jgi:hypothetical protein
MSTGKVTRANIKEQQQQATEKMANRRASLFGLNGIIGGIIPNELHVIPL